jgi:hypothetical protein
MLPRQPTDASTVVRLLQGQAWADLVSVKTASRPSITTNTSTKFLILPFMMSS